MFAQLLDVCTAFHLDANENLIVADLRDLWLRSRDRVRRSVYPENVRRPRGMGHQSPSKTIDFLARALEMSQERANLSLPIRQP